LHLHLLLPLLVRQAQPLLLPHHLLLFLLQHKIMFQPW